MGVAGFRFSQLKKSLRVRTALIGLLGELSLVGPVIVAIGATVMIVIKLCKDLPP